MPSVQNIITLKVGNVLQGSAEGPIGIGALLLIAIVIIAMAERWRRRL